MEEPEGVQGGRGRVAYGAGSLIAGASSFVRASWQQLRTGEVDGAGQDAGDAAAAGDSTAVGGEKLEAARAEREREQAEAVAQAKAALRGEMEAELQRAKAEATAATAAMAAAQLQHAADTKAAVAAKSGDAGAAGISAAMDGDKYNDVRAVRALAEAVDAARAERALAKTAAADKLMKAEAEAQAQGPWPGRK